MSMVTSPLLHDSVAELATRHRSGRRILDPCVPRRFHLVVRDEFLTPRGRVYKWQETAAELERDVLDGMVPTVAPARFTWRGLRCRTGSPKEVGQERELTFARGQVFDLMLVHTELTGAVPPGTPQADPMTSCTTIGYPGLPRSPAVDLLVLISWDVITFELLCTQLISTPDLGEVGSRAELAGFSGTEAQFAFSDPAAVARYRNARASAEHLGYGTVAGRPAALYTTRCLDCRLDVRSGPLAQRGRSSYWVTLHADLETRDLLSAEMTEMIVAVLIGEDGRQVPVQKRRSVRMWVPAPGEAAPRLTTAIAAHATPASRASDPVGSADPADLGEAVRLAARVRDYVAWQASWVGYLPEGFSELTLMGFRSVVGSDLTDAHKHVEALRDELHAALQTGSSRAGALHAALPEHRRRLEGLLAFGQLVLDGTERLGDKPQDAERAALHERIGSGGADLAELLAILGRLEQPRRTPVPAVHDPKGQS